MTGFTLAELVEAGFDKLSQRKSYLIYLQRGRNWSL